MNIVLLDMDVGFDTILRLGLICLTIPSD
uniref:Uncharacterized protein n=1 Tax=Arundo donax TaxID=35708 RepID=A0A0A9AYX9_ARUDO